MAKHHCPRVGSGNLLEVLRSSQQDSHTRDLSAYVQQCATEVRNGGPERMGYCTLSILKDKLTISAPPQSLLDGYHLHDSELRFC